MQLSINSITLEHAKSITALALQLGYTTTMQATESRIQEMVLHKDHCGFVAIADTKVIGWIHAFYTFRLESDAFVEIGGLVVDEQARRKGIGRKLIQEVLRWSRERSIDKIRVRCNAKRSDTHTFYRTLDFLENKEQKVFDKIIR